MNATDPVAMWDAWRAAVRRPAVDDAVRDLYARLDGAVQQRGPTCWISGRCCNFNAYGHRLYVTGLEIAWVLQQVDLPAAATGDDALKTACPFQVNNLCSIHAVRPLGCRIYFCQEGTQDWQHEVYERFLTDLRALHDEHALPYRYMEWRAGLAEAAGL
jgi:Fe-S-cluster containining protein